MLCSFCKKFECFEDLEFCKSCFDTVLCVSNEVQHYEPEPDWKKLSTPAEVKFEQDCKDDLSYEDIVEKMKNAATQNEYVTYWYMVKDFVGEVPSEGLYHTCPLCRSPIIVDQANCKVFRCAILVDGYVNPHASLSELINLRKSGVILAGCMAPLDLNNSDCMRIPTQADGSPFYY